MSLAVIIIAYNWSGRTRDFYKKYQTVIIENNPNAPRRSIKGARIILNKKNIGFAAAANQGVAETTAEYVLFLNDDCEITAAQIALLNSELKKNNWKAASPTLVNEDDVTQKAYQEPLPTFFSLVIDWSPLHRLLGHFFHSRQTVLPGACLLIRRQTLKKIGGWDETFWLWWEDVDLSYRLAQAGVRFGITENVRVHHVGGESFQPLADTWKKQVFFHSLRLFAHKHFRPWQSKIIDLLTSRFDTSTRYPNDV